MRFTLLMLVAGVVPVLIFWVEAQVVRRLRSAQGATEAAPEPV